MGARALYMMDCGGGEFDDGVLVSMQRPGEKIISPFSACVIDTDDGPVLVETGLDPDGRRDPVLAAGERASATKLQLREEDDIRARLKEIGLAPQDVRRVILSHMQPLCPVSGQGLQQALCAAPLRGDGEPGPAGGG